MWNARLLVAVLISLSSTVHAAQVCLDRDEFASHIMQDEQRNKELTNLRVQMPLWKQANDARKEEIRVKDELLLVSEEMQSVLERLNAAHEQREAERSMELANVRWWRNAGWSTAIVVTIGAVIMGVMK